MGIFNNIGIGKRQEVKISNELKIDVEKKRNMLTLQAMSSALIVADEKNIIISVNPAAMSMLAVAESDLQSALPESSASRLLGSNVDSFLQSPVHQQGLSTKLTSTYETEICIGLRTFHLIANPIMDNNKPMGMIVECKDITEKLTLESELDSANELAAEAEVNGRIKAALDSVSANVMMADNDARIVYMNAASVALFTEAEADIVKVLPNFNAAKLIGSSIDDFHKNSQHQRSIVSALTGRLRTEVTIGVRRFYLIATPAYSEDGSRVGTVVQWRDRTTELEFEAVIDNAIEAAVAGQLGARISISHNEGFFGKLAAGLNDLLDLFESVIQDVSLSLEELAEGRLTTKIEREYHGSFGTLKMNVNTTIDKLVNVVAEISKTALVVKEEASEISVGNNNLSQRTEQQAANLEETSAAMEQITTTVQQNAANAAQANTLAQGARETAENGGAVVRDAVTAMDAISESSNKINDIIGVIDEIAFQTNLLALNAAVEAARAGDQGRGFAVVADEVRNLAGRSATAAKEIKGLIKDSSEKVKEGSELVNKSGRTLDDIVDAVKKVNDIVAEISTASDEQATGLDEINRAVGEMDEMTQQNAALVEQATAASEGLGNQAESLEDMISFFDIGEVRTDSRLAQRTVQRAKSAVRPTTSPVKAIDVDDNNWSEF